MFEQLGNLSQLRAAGRWSRRILFFALVGGYLMLKVPT